MSLSLLQKVEKMKRPLLVTKFESAEISPPSVNAKNRSWLGAMTGEINFLGDFVSPIFAFQRVRAELENPANEVWYRR